MKQGSSDNGMSPEPLAGRIAPDDGKPRHIRSVILKITGVQRPQPRAINE